MTAAAEHTSIDLSKRDLTLDIARVFCVLLVVVIHLLFVGVGRDANGALVISRTVEDQPWFAPATWVGQIMPLFFVVGGFASITAYRSLRRRVGDERAVTGDYIRNRVLRLAQPALPLFVFYAVVLTGATLIGVPKSLLDTVAKGAGAPLWFIAAYALCQALVPFLVHCHERRPVLTLLVLAAGSVVTDTIRFTAHVQWFGLPNLLFVWPLVQQLGFWFADGWFRRRRWWQLVAIAAACYLAIWPLVAWCGYSMSMLDNLNPPTIPLVLLGVAQACTLTLLHRPLTALMRTRPARVVVFVVGTRLMTIYLWHLPIIIILSGVSLLIPGAAPAPASSAWWWSRPVLYVLVLAALFGLSFLVGRWESVKEVGPVPPTAITVLGVVLTFVPTFLVMQFFLNMWFAIVGVVLLGAAVLLLGRWPARSAARLSPG